MRVRQQWRSLGSDKERIKKHALIGGISSIAVLAAVATGTAAYNSTNPQQPSNSSKVEATNSAKTEVKISNDQLDVSSSVAPTEDVVSESYAETYDGDSKTRRYSTTTQDQSGNITTQDHSYTTNIDGSSAVDINLNSNSSSSSSVNSKSSVDIDVSSSSKVTSSGSSQE